MYPGMWCRHNTSAFAVSDLVAELFIHIFIAILRAMLTACMQIQDVEKAAQMFGSIPSNATAKVAKTGPVGSGKSSNTDSVASALTGRTEKPAGAGLGTFSLTIDPIVHELLYLANPATPQEALNTVNVSVVDTPGPYFDVRCLRCPASSLTRILVRCLQ